MITMLMNVEHPRLMYSFQNMVFMYCCHKYIRFKCVRQPCHSTIWLRNIMCEFSETSIIVMSHRCQGLSFNYITIWEVYDISSDINLWYQRDVIQLYHISEKSPWQQFVKSHRCQRKPCYDTTVVTRFVMPVGCQFVIVVDVYI
jgi:hypothetical protein